MLNGTFAFIPKPLIILGKNYNFHRQFELNIFRKKC